MSKRDITIQNTNFEDFILFDCLMVSTKHLLLMVLTAKIMITFKNHKHEKAIFNTKSEDFQGKGISNRDWIHYTN